MNRRHLLSNILFFMLSLLMLLPILIMVVGAFRLDDDLISNGYISYPSSLTTNQIYAAWDLTYSSIARSLLITSLATFFSVGLGAFIGASLSTARNRLAQNIQSVLLIALFLPPVVVIYPLIVICRLLGIFGSTSGLVFAHTIWGIPLTTIMFSVFFKQLSPDLLNAVKIDGPPFYLYARRIAIPIAVPVIWACIVLQFTYIWNDVIFGLTLGGANDNPVMVNVLSLVGGGFSSDHPGLSLAAMLISSAPTVALYIVSTIFMSSRKFGA